MSATNQTNPDSHSPSNSNLLSRPIAESPHPCGANCDWPICMSNNGTICLFNLPDDYYDSLARRNHPSHPDFTPADNPLHDPPAPAHNDDISVAALTDTCTCIGTPILVIFANPDCPIHGHLA